jgi:hypothetical protein
MSFSRRVVVCAALLALSGCATQVLSSVSSKGYTVGQRLSAPVGGVFLVAQTGTVSRVKRWVGIAVAPGGWQEETVVSQGYLRKELVYGGVSGSTVEIAYREFRNGFAAPAFSQNVRYDITTSRDISFQNFRIRIDSASNDGIQAVLLSDGG